MKDLEIARGNVVLYARRLLLGTATLEELRRAVERLDECLRLLEPRGRYANQKPRDSL